MNANDTSAEAAIDIKLGLDRYEGNQKIYANVLETFKRNNKDVLSELKNAVCADNKKLTHRIAHSLRGAAGTIGATRLADSVFRIEKLLSPKKAERDSVGGESLEVLIKLLESEYTAVYAQLELLVEEKEESGSALDIIDRGKTLGLIGKLTPFLKSGDANVLEYLDEINENFQSAANVFSLFITQMEQYDFEQALETLNSIRQFMGT